ALRAGGHVILVGEGRTVPDQDDVAAGPQGPHERRVVSGGLRAGGRQQGEKAPRDGGCGEDASVKYQHGVASLPVIENGARISPGRVRGRPPIGGRMLPCRSQDRAVCVEAAYCPTSAL